MVSVVERQSQTRPTFFQVCRCNYFPLNTDSSWSKTKLLATALGLLGSFFAVELTIGFWSNSLSLLADAGHMLLDMAALGLTLAATWLAQQPARGRATFGYQRAEVLAALINGVSLVAIALFVTWEAIDRLHAPEPILVLPMLVGSGLGLVVNSFNILLLHQHSQNDLNLRGAFLHAVADAASSVSVIVAAVTVYFWHWLWVDAAASLLVAGFTALSALPLIKSSLEVLMEYAPQTVDPIAIEAALGAFASVDRVEKLHIWTVTSGQTLLCAELTVETIDLKARDRLLKDLQLHLKQAFDIEESVLQLVSRQPAPLHPLFTQNFSAMFPGKHGDLECL